MAILAMLTGPLGKLAMYAGLAVALVLGALWIVHEHDAKVRAEVLAASQAQAIATMQADHAREISALQSDASRSAALAARVADIRSSISAAPRTQACAASPAINAALDGLRRASVASPGAKANHPAVASGVPGATAAAGPTH